MSQYQKNTTESARVLKSKILLNKFPNCIPVILNKSPTDKNLVDIKKYKYIIPKEMTVAGIIQIIRKQMAQNINENISIYLICNNIMLCGSTSIDNIYDMHKNTDGFVYIEYCGENVFG